MKKIVKRGRPVGSKNKPKSLAQQARANIKKNLAIYEKVKQDALIARQDAAIAQASDQIADLQGQVEFYRKQVNHFLALLNILAKGA